MANTQIDNAAAIDMLDVLVDDLDNGTGAATINIYDGTQPTTVDDGTPTGSTLLAQLTCSDPAFGNAADQNPNAQATASSITDDSSANASGTAAWFRAKTSGGTAIIDGDVSTTAAGTGDLQLNSTSISAGATVSITAWTVTLPEG